MARPTLINKKQVPRGAITRGWCRHTRIRCFGPTLHGGLGVSRHTWCPCAQPYTGSSPARASWLLPTMSQDQEGTMLASSLARRDLWPGRPLRPVPALSTSPVSPCAPPPPPGRRTEPSLALYGHVWVLGGGCRAAGGGPGGPYATVPPRLARCPPGTGWPERGGCPGRLGQEAILRAQAVSWALRALGPRQATPVAFSLDFDPSLICRGCPIPPPAWPGTPGGLYCPSRWPQCH